MAAFTSKATGVWSATGQTTWNEAGYPGELAADTVTIANGHVITFDLTSFPGGGMGATVVQSGGKLIIDVVMDDMTASFEANITVNSGGELEYTKTAGASRKLMISADLIMNGIFDMDSSAMAAGETLLLAFDSNVDDMTVGGTADVTVQGRTKTQKTLLNGAMIATAAVATMDDVTGWEDGDEILICGTTDNSFDAFDILTIDTAGITGNVVTFTAGATFAHADNARAVNLTCSSRIIRNDTSQQFATNVALNNGADVDIDYMQLDACSIDIKIDGADAGGVSPIENCVFRFRHASSNGQIVWYGGGAASNDLYLKNNIVHGGNRALYATTSHVLRMILEGWHFSYQANMGYTTAAAAFIGMILRNCEFHAQRNTSYGWSMPDVYQHPTFEGGWAWSNAKPYYLRCSCDVYFRDFDFGIDPGGNRVGQADAVNGVELTACDGANLGYSNQLTRLDRCRFADTDDENIVSGWAAIPGFGRIISYNHRRVAGGYFEVQRGGFIRSDTDDPNTGTRAFTVDARDTSVPNRFRFVFTVADGDVVTVTYYAKKSGSIAGATWKLGDLTGGMGGIASGSDLGGVITTSYGQFTLTFTSAADISGDVELLLEVDPGDGSADIIRIDDIAVSFA